jgi:hypothetical protein
MRAGELRAGERYGLDTLLLWPRLYPLLADNVKALVDDRRAQLDLAGRFCIVGAIGTAVSFGLLVSHAAWLAVPAGCLAVTWLSYHAAIAAAAAYGEALETAFDLHRFDLASALHLPLPDDLAAEAAANAQLSQWLRQPLENLALLRAAAGGTNVRYHHSSSSADQPSGT